MPYGCIAIWSNYGHMAVQPYGYVAIRVANMGVHGKSNKNVAIELIEPLCEKFFVCPEAQSQMIGVGRKHL